MHNKGRPRTQFECSVLGCARPAQSRNLCDCHYKRLRKYGSPLEGGPIGENARFRFVNWWRDIGSKAEPDDCLIWPFARAQGYGPHRKVCKIMHGNPPTELHQAAHSCGRGKDGCVNFHHLRWATNKENAEDLKSHRAIGVARPMPAAKLTDGQVRQIIADQSVGSGARFSRTFGVSESLISRIRSGERRELVSKGLAGASC